MAKRGWRNWSEEQWRKSFSTYLKRYNERYDYLMGHIKPELNFVQYKSAYMLFSEISNKNVIRTIVKQQDKYLASPKQIANDKKAVAGVIKELNARINQLEALPSTAANVNQIEKLKSQVQSMSHISRYEWKTQTGGAKDFWDYLKNNKKSFTLYVPSS